MRCLVMMLVLTAGAWAQERDFLLWRSELGAARRRWQGATESSRNDALLMGLSLAQAQSWRAKREHDLSQPERDFIDQSLRRDALERAQREKLRGRIRQSRRIRGNNTLHIEVRICQQVGDRPLIVNLVAHVR